MNLHDEKPTWSLLGYDRDLLDRIAQNMYTMYGETWENGRPLGSDNVIYWMYDTLTGSRNIFAMGWLGYCVPKPPLNDWQAAGRRLVQASLYYFFGVWRDKFMWCQEEYNRQSSRSSLPWSNAYRAGLALACAFSDWSSADKLLEWPGPDLPPDEGTDDRTREDNAYQIWLAMRLRGESEDTVGAQRDIAQRPQHREQDFSVLKAFRDVKDVLPGVEQIASSAIQRELIQRGSRRRPKMLMAAADAMLADDSEEFSKTLGAYLKHYRQKELQLQRIDTGICLDGMVLWHLARRRGLKGVSIPEDLLMLIARP